MAITIKTEGLTEVSRMLTELGDRAEAVAAQSLYVGAGVMADSMSKAVDQIRTEKFKGKRPQRLPSPEEKEALRGRVGIAKFKKNGSEVDTIIGIDNNEGGYVQLGNKTVPVPEIARSINSGTSFMKKQPVFRRAASRAKGPAVSAITERAEALFDEIIKGG